MTRFPSGSRTALAPAVLLVALLGPLLGHAGPAQAGACGAYSPIRGGTATVARDSAGAQHADPGPRRGRERRGLAVVPAPLTQARGTLWQAGPVGRFREIELNDVELTGTRLLLRRWRESDAERVHEVMRDPLMARFLPVPVPYTLEVARHYVTDVGQEGRHEGTGLGCAIESRADGRLVGSIALRLGAEAEIGYWIAADARGAGFAAEATRLLTDFGYRLGIGRVQLGCAVDNVASARTAMAAGFRFEGVARGRTLTRDERTMVFEDATFARLASDDGKPVAPAFPALPAGGLSDGMLALRGLRPGDEQGMFETDDAESVRWSFTGKSLARRDIEAMVRRAPLDWLVGATARFAMVDEASGAFAGHVDVRKSGPPQVGGVGYGVHPEFRGRGYTTRALRILVPWAFEVAEFARLELGAKSGNVASQRAAASAGFVADGVRIGRLRNGDGTFTDEVRYALLKPAAPSAGQPVSRSAG